MISIGVFEDHVIIQKGIVSIFKNLEHKYSILFAVNTKEELYEKLKEQTPDILIVDVMADGVSGLEIFEHLHENYKEIKSIAFTALSSPVLVENLLYLNVKGFVSKKHDIKSLIDAVESVSTGQTFVPEEYAFLTKRYYQLHSSVLTHREIEIVKFIAKELTSSEIAELLSLSVNTVENHRKNIFRKLNVKNVAGLVREASLLGYL